MSEQIYFNSQTKFEDANLTVDNLTVNGTFQVDLSQNLTSNSVYYDVPSKQLSYSPSVNVAGVFLLNGVVSGSVQYYFRQNNDIKLLTLMSSTIQKDATASQITSSNSVAQLIPTYGTPSTLFSCLEVAVGNSIYQASINNLGQLVLSKTNVANKNIPANQTFTTDQCEIVYL